MERRLKTAGNESLAVIVRQFSPSRIERELLARAFEVVVSSPIVPRDPSVSMLGSENQHGGESDQPGSQTKRTLTRSAA